MALAAFIAALAVAGGLAGVGIYGAPGGGSWREWLDRRRAVRTATPPVFGPDDEEAVARLVADIRSIGGEATP